MQLSARYSSGCWEAIRKPQAKVICHREAYFLCVKLDNEQNKLYTDTHTYTYTYTHTHKYTYNNTCIIKYREEKSREEGLSSVEELNEMLSGEGFTRECLFE